jgi:hypothetical protein
MPQILNFLFYKNYTSLVWHIIDVLLILS